MRDRTARVVVVGQGYVGLVVAMRAVEVGFPVVGLDVDSERIDSLAAGHSYVEDVADTDLERALAAGYTPTDDPADLEGFDIAVITVPTPLADGLPDLSPIESAATRVARALRPGALVILESTTYPGTTEELVAGILERESSENLRAGADYHLGYSPERIDPGNTVHGLADTPKIVSGVDAAPLTAVEAFYGSLVDKLVPVSSPAVAELSKLVENTFRHVNVALVNELAVFAHELGIDVWEAIDAADSKPFGFMAFKPGPGVGGHCLPVDPSYLSWRVKRRSGQTFRFIELANDVNDHMPQYVARRVQNLLNGAGLAVNGANILVLGVAYKPNTSDAREAPSFRVIDLLTRLGARVTAVDPHVEKLPPGSRFEYRTDLDADLIGAADLVVLVTDHDAFDYDLILEHANLVFDTRSRLPRSPGRAERL
ncbi:MAG: nucleotide sugar dehydrogenase [Acidimicrobiia bacterium]|nr:nucleotide sugar dehydrogenase [Acidimicrobiia bacterium]